MDAGFLCKLISAQIFHLLCPCQVYDLSVFRHLELFGKEQAGLRIQKTETNDTGKLGGIVNHPIIYGFIELNVSTYNLEIRYLGEAEVVFTCPINYSDFPFHVATCRLVMTSTTGDNSSFRFRNDLEPWPPGQVQEFIFNFYLMSLIEDSVFNRFWMETKFGVTLSMSVISLARCK